MSDKKDPIEDLRWVRLFNPVHIPKYLVEQVRDKDYTVEDFYKYQEINCTMPGKDGVMLNPFNHLYALVNKDNLVKGFLWCVIDPLSKDMIINTFSVDKEYWGRGRAVRFLAEHAKSLMKKMKIERIFWLTRYPKHSERHGFKRSKSVLMEYRGLDDGQDNNGSGAKTDGRDKHAKSGAAEPVLEHA